MHKHYNIPIFLPELACPFRCVYCNQAVISGQQQVPAAEEMQQIIEERLSTIPAAGSLIEIAFFGGNFTGLPKNYQMECLRMATQYLKSGRVRGIRLSTRPDYINAENLQLLKDFGVTTIELGAQSMDDEVLKTCGRGHDVEDVIRSSDMIRGKGFRLGLQMMIGLPGDNLAKAKETARRIIAAKADETRIYPCLVIAGTALEADYQMGFYQPLSLEEAVAWTAELTLLFEEAGVNIIRMGLHPSEELQGKNLIAGPFHPSFKELVMTNIWKKLFEKTNWPEAKEITIFVPEKERNFAIGYQGSNRKALLQKYTKVRFEGAAISKRLDFFIQIDQA